MKAAVNLRAWCRAADAARERTPALSPRNRRRRESVPLREERPRNTSPAGLEVATQTRGVFVAGAVQGPRSIEESVSHAIRTAGEVATYVKGLRRSENQ